jgi:hypothetical protein
MDKKTREAWAVHHATKLNQLALPPSDIQEMSFAGRRLPAQL